MKTPTPFERWTPRTLAQKGWQKLLDVARPLVRRHAERRMDLDPSLWRLVRAEDGALTLDGVRLDDVLSTHGSPLHLVDARKLDENVRDFAHVPSGAQGGCEVYYSYKTNPVPGVLERMHRAGVGAEVISEYELWLALKLGVKPERIVYNGPGKSKASIDLSVSRGIGLFNFNNREEIAPTVDAARRVGRKLRVGLRVVVPGGWSGQFGEPVETGDAIATYREMLRYPEALDVVALHCHLGGRIATEGQLTSYLDRLLAFADELHRELGLGLEILDVGGSLTCPTTSPLDAKALRLNRSLGVDLHPESPESVLSIRRYVESVVSRVEGHFSQAGRKRPRIFLEPGRAMTANTQMLLCRVMNLKASHWVPHAILDAGVNLAECCRNEYHQVFDLGPRRDEERQLYRLGGPICTPSDVLYWAWELPKLRVGDGLVMLDSGAYFVPFATSFSYPQPGIVMLEDGKLSVLRRAETFESMVSLDEGAARANEREKVTLEPTGSD